jgi:hypothetical protein
LRGLTPETSTNVTWTGATNASISGSDLSKSGGVNNTWDAGAYSSQTIASGDVRVEATLNNNNHSLMIGLSNSADAISDASYTTIDFAIFAFTSNIADAFENGSAVIRTGNRSFAFIAGDVFSVAIENGIVIYRVNDVIIHVNRNPTIVYPLRVDASFQTSSARWNSVKIITPA